MSILWIVQVVVLPFVIILLHGYSTRPLSSIARKRNYLIEELYSYWERSSEEFVSASSFTKSLARGFIS
jgi:hypothetical protein